jgi:hypothetical protein
MVTPFLVHAILSYEGVSPSQGSQKVMAPFCSEIS